jgi:hypothetical protein
MKSDTFVVSKVDADSKGVDTRFQRETTDVAVALVGAYTLVLEAASVYVISMSLMAVVILVGVGSL